MSIIWCGGEEIDFPNGVSPVVATAYYRSGYSRGALIPSQQLIRSVTFAPVTSAWVSARCQFVSAANYQSFGLMKSGTNSGIFIGTDPSSQKARFWKLINNAWTAIGTASVNTATGAMNKCDIQIVNLGANTTLRFYVNQVLWIEATGIDLSALGSDLDQVAVYTVTGASEFIVADEDTRTFSLVTLAPNAAGDVDSFTAGTYAEIDEFALSDADVASSVTPEQNLQVGLSNLPAGEFVVKGVRVAARCADGVGGMGVQVGIKTASTPGSAGTEGVDLFLQPTVSLNGSWRPVEALWAQNPATANRFTLADINNLQIAFRSKAV